jgi:type II secretory pathway pseudopilin PulG
MSEVLLLVVAAVFAWLAVASLRKIERQSQYAEENAQAAADAAKAALLIAENLARAERPWLLVSASPVPGSTNSFSIVATNRGRSPARVLSLAECIAIVRDETELPRVPIFKTAPRPPVAPTILLPGESVSIKTFSRDEVKTVCENPEEAQRIEEWAEKIYLYGNVIYNDLAASGDARLETGWCCWYIHGRQKSGMIMAGPPEYNRHT